MNFQLPSPSDIEEDERTRYDAHTWFGVTAERCRELREEMLKECTAMAEVDNGKVDFAEMLHRLSAKCKNAAELFTLGLITQAFLEFEKNKQMDRIAEVLSTISEKPTAQA